MAHKPPYIGCSSVAIVSNALCQRLYDIMGNVKQYSRGDETRNHVHIPPDAGTMWGSF